LICIKFAAIAARRPAITAGSRSILIWIKDTPDSAP